MPVVRLLGNQTEGWGKPHAWSPYVAAAACAPWKWHRRRVVVVGGGGAVGAGGSGAAAAGVCVVSVSSLSRCRVRRVARWWWWWFGDARRRWWLLVTTTTTLAVLRDGVRIGQLGSVMGGLVCVRRNWWRLRLHRGTGHGGEKDEKERKKGA